MDLYSIRLKSENSDIIVALQFIGVEKKKETKKRIGKVK